MTIKELVIKLLDRSLVASYCGVRVVLDGNKYKIKDLTEANEYKCSDPGFDGAYSGSFVEINIEKE